MKHCTIKLILSVVAVVAYVTPVTAEPYLGLGVGAAFYKADLSAYGGEGVDDNSTAFKFFGGYAFNKYFAVEADYYNFTEASVGTPSNNAAVSMTGASAYAVGSYPLNREINLIAKLGVLKWDANLRVNSTAPHNDGTDAAVSLGASFAFTKEVLATLEWEYFDSDNPELSLISAGFRYNFK